MATAVFSGAPRPVLVPSRKPKSFAGISKGGALPSVGELTIHRLTRTHHGRTLLMLGHAAEHLANSRRYSTVKFDHEANIEAIHILMGLSRSVFDEFADQRALNRQFEDWLVERAVRILE